MKVLPLCAITAILVTASSAHAVPVVFGSGGGTQRTDGGQVVGITLVSHGETISSLGFFDFGGDGLADSYQVGLWDSGQNLLATATVTPSSPLDGDFRYAAITPITLGSIGSPEAFTIGALLPADMADVWLDNLSFVILAVGFSGAGTGQFVPSAVLTYPTTIDDAPYYVVNANGFVPEPGGFALGVAGVAACLGIGWKSRRK